MSKHPLFASSLHTYGYQDLEKWPLGFTFGRRPGLAKATLANITLALAIKTLALAIETLALAITTLASASKVGQRSQSASNDRK